MQNSFRWGACILMLGALATGCNSANDTGSASDTTGSTGVRKQVNPEAARLASSMVSAVSAGGGAASVDVKFELTQRPEVGKPVDISLALIPTAPLERLYARFQAGDGLELVKGGQMEQVARPITGAAIAHSLTVVPQRDGIFTILAVVLMDLETESISRNFSIPMIAGKGLSEQAPKRAVADRTS